MRADFTTLAPLLPQVVASAVIAEAAAFSGGELPDATRLTAYLTNHAAEVTAANTRFRKILKSTQGRDFLYAFMRHWLAAELRRTQPTLYRRLPAPFAMGLCPEWSTPRKLSLPPS